MKKITYLILGIVLVLGIISFGLFLKKTEAPTIEYVIDGQKVQIGKGGVAYFGNSIEKDLDGDGRIDKAFIITRTSGGSGTFFYVVATLRKENEFVGSSAVFLGDRIAPQTTESGEGNSIVVNYADRLATEPMTTSPSVGKSLHLLLDPHTLQFGEIVQNFEGEANPNQMTLGMKKWIWQSTTYSDGKKVTPKKVGVFTLTLKNDNTFSATTDCNGVGGEYRVNGNKLTFTKMMSTLMYCEGSQEQDFSKMLGEVQTYLFTSKGELVLELRYDSGSMVFK